MNVAVYTAIFANYDLLIPCPVDVGATEMVCFTDVPTRAKGWDARVVDRKFDSPWLENRYYKILAHIHFPDVEYSIYHDGCMVLAVRAEELLAHLGSNDIAVFRHFAHNDIYDEAEAYLENGGVDPKYIHCQIEHYRQEGYPEDIGFYACGVIVRRHTDRMRRFNQFWWREQSKPQYAARADQIGFAYTKWKTGMEFGLLPRESWPGLFSVTDYFYRSDHQPKVLRGLTRPRVF